MSETEQPVSTPTPEAMTQQQPATPTGDTITTPSGLRYVYLQHGTGPQPKTGERVSVHYTGTLTNGSKFDSSRDRGTEYEFPLGQGRVIAGWEEAVALMKVGDRVLFTIPSDLAYGPQGRPPAIPENATLIFDIELLGVR